MKIQEKGNFVNAAFDKNKNKSQPVVIQQQ